eukprot:772728-Pyramimonas_sp.AAC.2
MALGRVRLGVHIGHLGENTAKSALSQAPHIVPATYNSRDQLKTCWCSGLNTGSRLSGHSVADWTGGTCAPAKHIQVAAAEEM